MPLTGLDIFKKLPKTNCGDCGLPTCMAFAMKVAARQSPIDACPHVSEDVKAELSEAAAAPVKKVTIGAGDTAIEVGEETVLFTHLGAPAMTRLRMAERKVLDTLVDAGVARSRSDALAWCVRLVGQHESDWLKELRDALAKVEEARAKGPSA